jgi:hypothetical protein
VRFPRGRALYLIYVDESGDCGMVDSPSRYFVLSGLVVHELRWRETLEEISNMRRGLRGTYGLKLREEIHAGHMMRKPGELARIPKSMRLRLLRDVVDFEAGLPDVSITNVVVDKEGKPADYDVFEQAWKVLIQRFENTISRRNFPGPQNAEDNGIVIVDDTDEPKLRKLTRRMRVYNPVPDTGGAGYRFLPLRTIVEDPVHRNSRHSYFIQLADVNAYFLYQELSPSKYTRNKGARNYFDRLTPILCTVANRPDPQGIVRL